MFEMPPSSAMTTVRRDLHRKPRRPDHVVGWNGALRRTGDAAADPVTSPPCGAPDEDPDLDRRRPWPKPRRTAPPPPSPVAAGSGRPRLRESSRTSRLSVPLPTAPLEVETPLFAAYRQLANRSVHARAYGHNARHLYGGIGSFAPITRCAFDRYYGTLTTVPRAQRWQLGATDNT